RAAAPAHGRASSHPSRVVSARWLYCERRSGACGGRARSSLFPAAAARDAPRVFGYASSVVAALARLGSRLDALATSHRADTTLTTPGLRAARAVAARVHLGELGADEQNLRRVVNPQEEDD